MHQRPGQPLLALDHVGAKLRWNAPKEVRKRNELNISDEKGPKNEIIIPGIEVISKKEEAEAA